MEFQQGGTHSSNTVQEGKDGEDQVQTRVSSWNWSSALEFKLDKPVSELQSSSSSSTNTFFTPCLTSGDPKIWRLEVPSWPLLDVCSQL